MCGKTKGKPGVSYDTTQDWLSLRKRERVPMEIQDLWVKTICDLLTWTVIT